MCAFLTTFLVVTMALDRLLILFCPIQHHNYSTKATVNKIILGIILLAVLHNLPTLYFVKVDSNSMCTFLETTKFKLLQDVYRFVGGFVLFFGIPMSFLFVANILFVISLCRRQKPVNDFQMENKSAAPQTPRTGTSAASLPPDANEERRSSTPAEVRAKKWSTAAQTRAKKKADSQRRYVIMLVALTLSYLLFHATTAIIYWMYTRYLKLSSQLAIFTLFQIFPLQIWWVNLYFFYNL